MNINDKLAALRIEMKKEGIDGLIVSGSDPHQSEYIADTWQDRQWISGFTGSAGIVVITLNHAGLWTDSRYFLQGEDQLSSSEFVLHKQINQFEPEHLTWLNENLPKNSKVAIDGADFSKSQLKSLQSILGENNTEVIYRIDLISRVWLKRPALPKDVVFEHDVKYAGASRREKIAAIREEMKSKDCHYFFMTALDDIAWSLNLRGSDVESNPVFISYCLVGEKETYLFVDGEKLSTDLKSKLQNDGITLKPYDAIIQYVNELDAKSNILVDPALCNSLVYESINAHIIDGGSIPKQLKAIKNSTEIAHVRKCMAKDGAALANSFYWLEQTLDAGKTLTEFELAEKLAFYRSQQEGYVGESFNAIIGYQSNGAVIHYRPMPDTSKTIKKEGMLLCDSGGQYHDGTTDITRTFALSKPTDEQKSCFTAVLKGMIALTMAVFPEGTSGGQLDILARQYLWQHGLNYGHGTGHGVGFFLNVHEPPQGFAAGNSERSRTIQKEGMLTSNEPGFYKNGAFGIRLENLIITNKHPKHEGFLCFEDVTLYPIDISLIEEEAMTSREKAWFNNYHKRVYDEVSPLLSEEVKSWFKWKCRPLN
jgi:Xaa-Pro aminopeptidase